MFHKQLEELIQSRDTMCVESCEVADINTLTQELDVRVKHENTIMQMLIRRGQGCYSVLAIRVHSPDGEKSYPWCHRTKAVDETSKLIYRAANHLINKYV